MKWVCTLFLLLLLTNAAHADSTARTDPALADSSLKLAAMLRVTGLVCTDIDHKPLYPVYQLFMRNNAAVLKSYQAALLDSYRKKKVKDPEKALHARETDVENEQSLIAAKAGLQDFCPSRTAMLQKAAVADPAEVNRLIEEWGRP